MSTSAASGGETPPTRSDRARRWLLLGLALLAAAGAVLRAFGVGTIDRESLYFLLAAGALALLERVRRFNLGRDGIAFETIEEIRAQVKATHDVTEANQRVLIHGVGGKARRTETPAVVAGTDRGLPPITVPEDPQKGRFGGIAERDGRRLRARVEPSRGSPGNFDVRLEVVATPGAPPLEGEVTFHLHDTFTRPVQTVPVVGGVARLDLLAYGAFTAGAAADGGATRLELDLAEDETFPRRFRES